MLKLGFDSLLTVYGKTENSLESWPDTVASPNAFFACSKADACFAAFAARDLDPDPDPEGTPYPVPRRIPSKVRKR